MVVNVSAVEKITSSSSELTIDTEVETKSGDNTMETNEPYGDESDEQDSLQNIESFVTTATQPTDIMDTVLTNASSDSWVEDTHPDSKDGATLATTIQVSGRNYSLRDLFAKRMVRPARTAIEDAESKARWWLYE